MWDEWAKKISAANGSDSGNIYQNYATAGVVDANPEAFTGKKAAYAATAEENAAKAANAAKNQQLQDEAQKIKDSIDPNKVRMAPSENGGYEFFDGNGQKIDINKFSLIVGKRPDQILADSEDPKDQQFVRDYSTMRDIASAWVNNDQDTLAKYRANPANIYKDDQGVIHNKFDDFMSQYKTPADMVNGFKQFYGNYYGGQTAEAPAQMSTPQAFNGATPPGVDKNNAAWKNLATATPEQNQQFIQGMKPPTPGEGFGGWINSINPFSAYNQQKSSYEDYLRNNPWANYYSSIIGR